MTFDPILRLNAMEDFLAAHGLQDAQRIALGADASTRRYFRLTLDGGETRLLMDAPPVEPPICGPEDDAATREAKGWNALTRLAASRVDAFVLVAKHLRGLGVLAPLVYAHDSKVGFALLEDFGTHREFARLIESGRADEVSLYTSAAKLLADLHSHPIPDVIEHGGETWQILPFDRLALQSNADLYADWLPVEAGGTALSGDLRARWYAERDELISMAEAFPRTLTLRDFHAENLLWLDDSRQKIGVLDFQDAVVGWDVWDIAMLTQDARREVSPEAAEAVISHYLEMTGKAREAFEERLAVIGALNALRIAGVFSRLQHRDGKPRYGNFQGRQLRMLAKNLEHPSLAGMRAFVAEATPFVFEGLPGK